MFTKALLTGLALTIAAPAFALGNCKDVYIKAVNDTGKEIKVIDMDYKISGYGKKSDPIKNADIPKGQFFSVTRNLERANERNTQVIIKYRIRKKSRGFDQWTGVKKASSSFQECKRGRTYTLSLPNQ